MSIVNFDGILQRQSLREAFLCILVLPSFLSFEDVVQTIADLDPEHLWLDQDSDIQPPANPSSKLPDDRLTFPGSGREYYYYKLPHKVACAD